MSRGRSPHSRRARPSLGDGFHDLAELAAAVSEVSDGEEVPAEEDAAASSRQRLVAAAVRHAIA